MQSSMKPKLKPMKTPEFKPKIMPMPGFRIMEEYDGWDMLDSVFGHCDLNRLREQFWDMYKSAMVDQDTYRKKTQRNDLNDLCDLVNDVMTAAYLLFEQKGYKLYYEVDAVAAFFPAWQRFTYDPWDVLFKIFDDYTLDEIRGALWAMYKSAFLNRVIYHGRRDRRDLIEFFERLNDLVTAAYVITQEKFDQIQKEKEKAKKQDAKKKPDTANPGGFISLRK